MSDGYRYIEPGVEVLDADSMPYVDRPRALRRRARKPIAVPLALFVLTVFSTLAVGSEFARSYANNLAPFSEGELFSVMVHPLLHPRLLLSGIPFSFTLLTILMAHELGHYFACKVYGIDVSYPYFLPAPSLFGTFGAFIRIRSPIPTRRALFDVGIAGPVAGFLVAVPAMAIAVYYSKVIPDAQANALVVFGSPPLLQFLIAMFHSHATPENFLLHPVGQAAWVGLFATALNLLPAWQLDGGHIIYSLTDRYHRRISLAAALTLVAMGMVYWRGWVFWGLLLCVLSLRFRHPTLYDPYESLDAKRRLWAIAALVIFLLSFTLWPTTNP
ncbi:MAG: site-2 protease family protein [Candidatus Acidiferrales bacterium]